MDLDSSQEIVNPSSMYRPLQFLLDLYTFHWQYLFKRTDNRFLFCYFLWTPYNWYTFSLTKWKLLLQNLKWSSSLLAEQEKNNLSWGPQGQKGLKNKQKRKDGCSTSLLCLEKSSTGYSFEKEFLYPASGYCKMLSRMVWVPCCWHGRSVDKLWSSVL